MSYGKRAQPCDCFGGFCFRGICKQTAKRIRHAAYIKESTEARIRRDAEREAQAQEKANEAR